MITVRNRPRAESQFIDVFDEEQTQKAILYRKAKFDKGVEVVQNQINQIEQLPYLAEKHGVYIKDKINSLVSNINSMSGNVDFSNQININGISKMSEQIVQDPIILSAVSSARNHQKNLKFIEDAKLNPKKYGNVISIQNEDDYYSKLNEYKQNIELGKEGVFNYTYKPYKDVEGILSKEMEKIKSDISMGLSGNYFTKDEAVTPQKIREIAFRRVNSDPSLSEQVLINANYSTRGVSDDSLLLAKNKAQLLEIQNRRNIAEKRLVDLYSVDLKDPKKTANLVENVKKEISKYENYTNLLAKNPNKIIDIDSGEDSKFNRKQLIYELSLNDMANNLANKFSYNKKTVSVNPIPLKEAELNWKMKMDNLDYQMSMMEFNRKLENDKIDRQLKSLDINTKVKVNDDLTSVGLGTPDEISSVNDDNIDDILNNQRNNLKGEAKSLLKNIILEKLNAIQGLTDGKNSSVFLNKFVESMFDSNDKLKNLAEDENIRRLQINSPNSNIDKRLARESIKFINKLSKDVSNVWNNDDFISIDNARILKDYTDKIHHISALNITEAKAKEEALRQSGLTNEQYNKIIQNDSKDKYIVSKMNEGNRIVYNGSIEENRNKLTNYNKLRKDYLIKRFATAKISPVVNFNEDSKEFNNLQKDVSRYINDSGSIDGNTSFGNIKGKEDVWSKFKIDKNNAEIIPIEYSPKSELVKVKIKYKEEDEKKEIITDFKIPSLYMDKYIPNEARNKNTSYDDLLNLTDNGILQNKVFDGKKYVMKDVWKNTVSPIPLTWKARKLEPNNPNSKDVKVYLKLPVNGTNVIMEMNNIFSSATVAEEQLTGMINEIIETLKKRGLDNKEIKNELLKYLQTANGRN